MDSPEYLICVQEQLLSTAQKIVGQQGIQPLVEIVLAQAQALSQADVALLYLVEGEGLDAVLTPFSMAAPLQDDLSISQFLDVALYQQQQPNLTNALSYALHQHVETSLEMLLQCPNAFMHLNGFVADDILIWPLITEKGTWVGVLQLLLCSHNSEFPKGVRSFLQPLVKLTAESIFRERTHAEQSDVLVKLASEPNATGLLNRILASAQALTHADGGTLYLFNDDFEQPRLQFSVMRNKTLGIALGEDGETIHLPDIPLYLPNGQENHHHIAAYSALKKELVNIEDAYHCDSFDFSGTKHFDQKNNYRSVSCLTIPLLNHSNELIGVLQLLNAQHPGTREVIPFAKAVEPLVGALASYAAIALDNLLLVDELKNLLNAFIKAIAAAIDAKSPHTSGHCQRVPLLMDLIAQAACNDRSVFRDFQLDDDEWYELKVASWLHDCGKLATPDSVLEKATKLHTLCDRINAIEARFSVIAQQNELKHWRYLAENPELSIEERQASKQALTLQQAQLAEDLAFLRTMNTGGEFMAEPHKARVRRIADQQWQNLIGEWQPLLTEDEVLNLCIERGTLNAAEREIINDHMRVTIEMLESLPFPRKLRRVPEYAGGHHEKMDGSGFPKGLTREQMSIPARMMAVADIFEALTAKDRPYKPAMKISQALTIMQRMRDDQHIDADIYQLFLQHRVWEVYAQEVLAIEQLDVDDIQAYL